MKNTSAEPDRPDPSPKKNGRGHETKRDASKEKRKQVVLITPKLNQF
jgi:hypothetical protein